MVDDGQDASGSARTRGLLSLMLFRLRNSLDSNPINDNESGTWDRKS